MAEKQHLAPPEFFDFPAIEIRITDEAEVKKLIDRVLAIQFFSSRTVQGVSVKKISRKKLRPKRSR
jgi:uncharacterized ubiquitin-like protein YukD